MRIALANLRFPKSPDESIALAENAIAEASRASAALICFPECYVPGYRGVATVVPPPDAAFLERARNAIASAAKRAHVAVILGTERIVDRELRATAFVVDTNGDALGFQDKVQLDPSEDETYVPGSERQVFEAAGMKFGIAICHEGWRYPETVRWAVKRGAQIVFHPHFHPPERGGFVPETFGDPRNTFHEKAMLCRAAENTCWFASVNYASAGSPTTSAVITPEGTLHCYQPYGEEGLLITDIDLGAATRLLTTRCRYA
jgi:predicted amidohydrolase